MEGTLCDEKTYEKTFNKVFPQNFYRYETYRFSHLCSDEWGNATSISQVKVRLSEFKLIKETPKGWWIGDFDGKTWVSKTAKKRYAYPTKKQAMEAYIARTSRYAEILEFRSRQLRVALKIANIGLKNIENE